MNTKTYLNWLKMVKMILGGLNGSELLKILKMVLSCTKIHKMTPNGPEWF